MLIAYIKHIRMRTYQRSIDDGARDCGSSMAVVLMPTAPYRVRHRFATGHVPRKMRWVNREMASRGGNETLSSTGEVYWLHNHRRRLRVLRTVRSLVGREGWIWSGTRSR